MAKKQTDDTKQRIQELVNQGVPRPKAAAMVKANQRYEGDVVIHNLQGDSEPLGPQVDISRLK